MIMYAFAACEEVEFFEEYERFSSSGLRLVSGSSLCAIGYLLTQNVYFK